MKTRPIIFSAPMVRAILEGRKTQTRRIIKPQLERYEEEKDEKLFQISAAVAGEWWFHGGGGERATRAALAEKHCPHGAPGDSLWVRESFYDRADYAAIGKLHKERIVYVADGVRADCRAHPSIHMPRWASRITLEITDVRVQRLQDITPEDARAEGVEAYAAGHNLGGYWTTAFARLWDSINAKRAPCESNPWVWAISFQPMGLR